MGVFANTFNAIANAIKAKDGGGDMTPAQMAGRIAAIGDMPPGGWINDGNYHFWLKYNKRQYNRLMFRLGDGTPFNATMNWYRNGSLYHTETSSNGYLHWYSNVLYFTEDEIDRVDIITNDLTHLKGTYSNRGPFEFEEYDTRLIFAEFGNSYIGSNTEKTCSGSINLKIVKVNSTSTNILGEDLYYNCMDMRQLSLPNTITEIGNNCFTKNCSLTEIELPTSLESIGNYSFYNSRIAHFNARNTALRTIGSYAFMSCGNLTSLDFPDTLESIGADAFIWSMINENPNKHFIFRSVTPPTAVNELYFYNVEKIYVPSESVNAYKAATNWSNWASKIEAIPQEFL